MSAAIDLVKSLAAAGVEFSTDGERIRWRNADGKVTPDVAADLATAKAEVIDFLTRTTRLEPSRPDADVYADALRLHGPMTYGVAMLALGWGGTRASQAEAALRAAGRITFNKLGQAVLVCQLDQLGSEESHISRAERRYERNASGVSDAGRRPGPDGTGTTGRA